MFSLLPLLPAGLQKPIEIRQALAIANVAEPGRAPVPRDAIMTQILRGEAIHPIAGNLFKSDRGTSVWHKVEADKNGVFTGPEFEGGYAYATVDSPTARTVLLVARGNSFVYVNGELRTGDPYGYGYLKLPIHLKAGENTFLFSVSRGSLQAELDEPSSAVSIDTADTTLPDETPSDSNNLFGGVVIINSTEEDAVDLSISCSSDGQDVVTALPRIPAMSLRKVRFDFSASASTPDLILLKNGKPIHSARLVIRKRKAGETYKRTFESAIDGSVQYYAVNPSSKPDKSNALILSLHGASVEAIGQASAYTSKDWATLVAPTNRRPFGFDWEEWGRMDGIEVLNLAGSIIPHDPKRVVLTGHSMGGHGTWSLGTLYPDRFGATAPSAGWISFWSYAGGWEPKEPTPPEAILRRSLSPSDTLARASNLTAEKVYVLHGDADDNVPVEQARTMKKTLTDLGIEFGYHEEPGAGHWWGPKCVDYPDLMQTLSEARISDFKTIDFTTPDPSVSSTCDWISIEQQEHPRQPSLVKGDTKSIITQNVYSLRFNRAFEQIKVDNQNVFHLTSGSVIVKRKGSWRQTRLSPFARHVGFIGPLKQAFNDRFVLVYATRGSSEENTWTRNKARMDAETFYYRGNGSPEVVSDAEFLNGDFKGRNVAVYGNRDCNLAWLRLLGRSELTVSRSDIRLGDKRLIGDNYAALFVSSSANRLVAAIGGTGLTGMRLTERIPVFGSGTAFPDWTILGPEAIEHGTKGVVGAGFFGPNWEYVAGESGWLIPK